jgi:hypothetical protein
MAHKKKEPLEKFKTKLKKIITGDIKDNSGTVKVKSTTLFKYDKVKLTYSRYRYFPTKIESIVEDDYEVTIPFDHNTLQYISSSSTNPPNLIRAIIKLIRDGGHKVERVFLGSANNAIKSNVLYLTCEFYDEIAAIYKEEGKDKDIRLKTRLSPFFNTYFKFKIKQASAERDYGLLLKEIINSGKVTQKDIVALTSRLDQGKSANIVIEKQINKQVKWLIETIDEILEEEKIDKSKAQELGYKHFGFPKISISGAEHLMEMILTKYGQYTLFGVPAMLNTDKYVIHSGSLSRSQFDLILVNHLGEIEVVELKRPDHYLLDFDASRNKFYPSTDLSIGVSQAERYISCVLKDNDEDYKIQGKKIREFLQSEIGNTLFIETVRPSALIVMGSNQHIYEKYENLKPEIKKKIKKTDYNTNGDRAFRELKGTFKNINILTYSELLEHARTRLELTKK